MTKSIDRLTVNIETEGGIAFVQCVGEALDVGNAATFKRTIEPVCKTNQKIALDMTKLEFIDSSGIGVILFFFKQLNSSGGDLKIFGLLKQVQMAFEMVRINQIIDIHDNREEVLKSFY